MNHPVSITSLACALPRRRVANEDAEFAALRRELPENWWQFWGIQRRPFMDRARETAESLAFAAAERALRDAGVAPHELDLVLANGACTTLRDREGRRMCPRISHGLSKRLGATHALHWDVEMGCMSFALLLQQATEFVRCGLYARVLICSVETASESLDFTSKDSTTFGDGAAAALIERRDSGCALLGSAWESSAQHYSVATLRRRSPLGGGPKAPYFTLAPDGPTRMMGFVPKTVPSVVQRVLNRAGFRSADIAQFIFHQPGRVLVDAWAYGVGELCGDIGDRYPVTLAEHGCLGSVAIPSTLHMTLQRGAIRAGDHVVIAGLGIGWGYGAQLWRWADTRVSDIVVSDTAAEVLP